MPGCDGRQLELGGNNGGVFLKALCFHASVVVLEKDIQYLIHECYQGRGGQIKGLAFAH